MLQAPRKPPMPSTRRAFNQFLCGTAALWAATGQAQSSPTPWPSKAVRLVVPYPAGGVLDGLARALAERLALALGQAVIVDNRASAGGVMGMDTVAKASDGHTLALSAISPLTLLPHLMPVPYDALADFAPVSTVMYSPVFVVATPAFSGKRFEDLIAQAKAQPGKLSLATSGVGTVGHIMLEQIKRKAGVDILHIPYKGGGGQILSDAAGGHFECLTTNASPALANQVAQGRLRILAATGPARLTHLPDTPTLQELGHAQANLTSLFGLFAPARTPPEVVARLNTEIHKILAQKDVQDKMLRQDNIPKTSTPAQLAAILKAESAANARVIQEAHIRIE